MDHTKQVIIAEQEDFQTLLEKARQLYLDTTGETAGTGVDEFVTLLISEVLSSVDGQRQEFRRQRQQTGIEMAKERGVCFGRPRCPLPKDFTLLLQAWEEKQLSMRDVLQRTGFSESTFYRRLREYRQGKIFSE